MTILISWLILTEIDPDLMTFLIFDPLHIAMQEIMWCNLLFRWCNMINKCTEFPWYISIALLLFLSLFKYREDEYNCTIQSFQKSWYRHTVGSNGCFGDIDSTVSWKNLLDMFVILATSLGVVEHHDFF